MYEFNNRELATATVILIAFAYCLSNRKVRPSLSTLLKSALHWKIAFTVLASWVVAAVGIWVLDAIGVWNGSLLKDAVIWSVFSGTALAFRGVSDSDPNTKFKALVMDQIKGIVVFQFLVNVYSMSYLMELVWVVLMSLVTLFIVAGESKGCSRPVVSLFRFAQGLLGLFIMAFVLYSLWNRPSEVFGYKALQSFLLPIFLALWLLPFGYVASLIAGYELMFIRLKIGRSQPLDLRIYSQFKLIEFGGLNSSRLRRMGRLLGPRTSWPKSHDEVDQLFLALGKTMQDPVLDEAGDFVWPQSPSRNVGLTIDSIVEYRLLIDPMIDKLVGLESAAFELMDLYLSDEDSKFLIIDGLRARFSEMENTVEIATSLPDLAPRVRRLDRRFQDYVASVDDLYRMIVRQDDKGWEYWRATAELYSQWCREARVRMDAAIVR